MKDEQFDKLVTIMKPQPMTIGVKILIGVSISTIVLAMGSFFSMNATLIRMEVTIDNMEDQMLQFEDFTKEKRYTHDHAATDKKEALTERLRIENDLKKEDSRIERKAENALSILEERKEFMKERNRIDDEQDDKIEDNFDKLQILEDKIKTMKK